MVMKEQGKSAPVRRARLLPENWQTSWQVLRTFDKWSGTSAIPEMETLFLDDAEEVEDYYGNEALSVTAADGTTCKVKRNRCNGGPQQSRPLGHKAAKRAAKSSKEDQTALL